ncbi:thermosome subunit [Candidatus Marsarchaeota G1 archaeon BE_D]|jgi:thermosome, various subunits, archaeal|uniref:Thermosome subunit n=1 Tax=Candidatus Marsarchaeota G1 archaeon BE_D TaxID=1978156 RepID=A0A2R6AKE7_9ARCH|nr:MAG: thermosome subunit [Candidatus Marsarchaeota G1 archaeon BE_D]
MAIAVPAVGGQPVLILKEGSQRSKGREALHSNIAAAVAVAEVIRTTLGPKGLDKMLVDSLGEITVTNDGATILKNMDVQHPAAKLMVQISKTQDDEVGDGTKTTVVLAGELLRRAEELVDKKLHPTMIVSGYRKAEEEAMRVIAQIAKPIQLTDKETLKKIAITSMNSKSVSDAKEHLANIAVDAVLRIAEKRGEKNYVDVDLIQVIKKQGGGALDTQLIMGVVIDKEVVHPGMPKRVENAKIALLDTPLEIEKTEIDAEIRITNPEQMKAFLDQETQILREMVEKLAKVGANVVICQKGIDDVAQHFLAKKGILAVRRAKQSDMEKLARATGARIVTNIDDLTPQDLGEAQLVEERRVANEKMVFVEGCKNPRAVSVVVRAGLERAVDEIERSLHDAFKAVGTAVMDPRILPGAGATYVEIARKVREYATKVGGKEQLAVEAFADAVEIIPKALAENAGLDPINVITELRAVHTKQDGFVYGVDITTGKPIDAFKYGIIEPANLTIQAIRSAVEAASAILRIDDVVAAAKSSSASKGSEKKESEKKESESSD